MTNDSERQKVIMLKTTFVGFFNLFTASLSCSFAWNLMHSLSFSYFKIFILGATCRMVSKIESGDRFVRQIRVEPIQGQTNLPGQVTNPQQQTANKDGNSHNSKWSTIQRQNWAKRDPKYKSVFTLLDQ